MDLNKGGTAMKKYFTSLMLLASLAMAFSSCNKEIDVQKDEPVAGKMKTITVKTDIETRTTLDGNHENILWSAGDIIKIFNNADTTSIRAPYVSGADLEIQVPAATTEIYAHYPYWNGNKTGPQYVSININKNQKQTKPGELNGYNFPMVAKGTVSADNKALISLYPVASALALNIYHTGLNGEESVKSVTVTPTENTNYIGSKTIDIRGDEVIKFTEGGASNPVTVTLTEPLNLGNTKPADKQKFAGQIYVCLAKQSYADVKFEIETSKGTYTITSSDTPFDCVNNDFVPVNINLAKAQKEVEPTVFTVGTEIASIFPTVKNGIKVSFAQGEGTNAPIYYSPFRCYVKNTITVSAGSTPLKGIELTFAGGNDYVRALTPSTGSFTLNGTTGTWVPAGSETSVTFTNGTSGQARFSSIKVTTDSDGTESVVTSTPTLTVADLEVAAGSSATLSATTNYLDGTKNVITYSSGNTSVATVGETTGVVSGVASGTATITATIPTVSTDWYVINSASTTCTVTVTQAVTYNDVTVNDWDYKFESNPWGATSGDKDLTSGETTISWSLTAAYASYTSGYLALNSGSNKNEATIKTNNVITNVNKVVVYAKTNKDKKVTLTVKAGNTTLGSQTLNNVTELTAYTFTSTSTISGQISIEFTNPDGGYQIKEIRINPVEYSITCATPNNGTISASSQTALSGTTVQLTATPDTGYQLDAWDVYKTGESSTKVTVTGNSFTMPAYNVTVTASFVKSSGGGIKPEEGTCFNLTTYGSIPTGWTCSEGVSTGSYFKVDAGNTMVSPAYDITGYNTATVSIKVAKFGTGTNPAAKLYVSYDGGSTWSETKTLNAPTSSTYLDAQILNLSKDFTNNVVIKLENPTGNASLRVQNFSFTVE